MIYIEYFERDRFMDIEIFRTLGDQSSWVDPDDKLVASLGRTLRLGPHPSYMAMWKCKGMARLDEWEQYFRSDEGLRDLKENAALKAVHMVLGGCYDEVVEGPEPGDGVQFVEFFNAGPEVTDAEAAAHFNERAQNYPNGTLNLVLRRIGLMGPDPGDLAVWTFPSYEEMEGIAREHHENGLMQPATVGIYRKFGDEVL